MCERKPMHYFLGANSPTGFASLYDSFVDPQQDHLYILKGGPGCGKSSFMRRIAADLASAGLESEQILCSGDPDSLDGVYFPALRTGFVDGTAPHVVEPNLPGINGSYIHLGSFYNTASLKESGPAIALLQTEYRRMYQSAYRYLEAARLVQRELTDYVTCRVLTEKIQKKAQALLRRELEAREFPAGRLQLRYLDAFTCRGPVTLWDTVQQSADRIFVVENRWGLAPLLLARLASQVLKKNIGGVVCPDPMEPKTISHILLPQASLAFCSAGSYSPFPTVPTRRIALDALAMKECSPAARDALQRKQHLHDSLLSEAQHNLERAKKLHDEMEEYYNPHVNFEGVYDLAAQYSRALLAQA